MRSSENISLRLPEGCDFWLTVRSHGWCALPPFSHNPKERTLSRVFTLPDGEPAAVRIRSTGDRIAAEIRGAEPLSEGARRDLRRQIASCLRLDEDLTPFHREARRHPRYRWIASAGAGRLLRAPTMFEDAVKMICTTNCSWELTTIMVTNLVGIAGRSANGTGTAFPTPSAVAQLTEKILRKEVKTGYRAPYLLELADAVASGRLDIEEWRTSSLSTEELYSTMQGVKGIGPYAAANLLKLAGRYDRLGLDSWVRGRYYVLRRGGRRVKDATIERDYAQYGQWRGLFLWLEMTREWHEGKFPL